jgi:hypothetical protein
MPLTTEQRSWLSTLLNTEVGSGAPPVLGKGAPGAPQKASGSAAARPAQGAEPTGGGPGDFEPATSMPSAPPANEMKDEDIAAAIMDRQAAILAGWNTALLVFDKTMTSSADAEATPNFQKVVIGYFSDKIMGAIIKRAPGASELEAVAKALDGEIKRAAAASASATLRDFVVQHAQAIGALQQAVLSQRQGFISAVRAKREAVEAPQSSSGSKKGKWAAKPSTKADDDYAMMRMALLDTLAKVDSTLKVSTSQALFRVLSEEWVRSVKVSIGMGVKVNAVVVIRLNKDYSILDAHIQGAGGQKLAEQLLKDSPDGVDVFHLQAPRRILLMADNGWPSVTLSLDANNRDTSTGSFGEGDTDSLRRYVMSKGLPPTKKLTGD